MIEFVFVNSTILVTNIFRTERQVRYMLQIIILSTPQLEKQSTILFGSRGTITD